jgi:hypothetical protein
MGGPANYGARPYTFAALSPGNTVFATAYNTRFPIGGRYVNVLVRPIQLSAL